MDSIVDFFKNIDCTTISISSNLVIIGLIIWVIIKLFSKSFITSLGNQTVELLFTKKKKELEQSIESASLKALAEHQAELDKKKMEYETDYTFYYTERKKVHVELYRKIQAFYDNAILFTGTIFRNTDLETANNEIKNTGKVYENSLEELRVYYNQNRIYIQKELSQNIETLFNRIGKLCEEFSDEYVHYINTSLNIRIIV